jgi:catechol 2,3-dioxygenase-like lactoylglutathione lyase family enzyme
MIWYQVRDLDAARRFYVGTLGFVEEELHAGNRWALLTRGRTAVGLSEGQPESDAPVAAVDVDDVRAEADRLRAAGAEVGTVLELHGEIRIVDVFDPDGNRLQFVEELRP